MTFDDLIPAWHSSRNAPDPAQLEQYRANVVNRLGKEYRDFLWHVGTATALTIFLAGGFVQYLRSGGAFDWQHEWAAIVFLLLPVGVAAIFLRGFIRHRRQHPRYDLSILDALRALIDENRLARVRLRVSMGVLTLAMALTPVVTHQLQLVGKQRPHEAASMLVVFGLAYVAAMAWQLWKYRWKLLPENARLQKLFGSYGRGDSAANVGAHHP
jgi:MFS family permease